ncbi:Chromosome partitioning protein ParA [Sphingomonas sp. EC-HK361]|uniref:ParA family protein n=1 Tax=Sphingomonas sp. EC-HK361 TaxID=2038397 RepID=UPI001250FDD1|nr:ParA family protein [Sphingomonas sp. EC-HK361]VVT04576.1 Chromosome partitioning protein ParA [Sphingomonas sp. EC-HK361]
MATIAIYSLKGGVGKTTLAVNLAWCAASLSARRTLLWDLDAQGAASWMLHAGPARQPASALFQKDVDPAKLVQPTAVARLDLIAADASLRDLDRQFHELDRKKRLRKLVESAARDHDRVILDCPPGLGDTADQAIRSADLIVVPVIPSPLSARAYAAVTDHVGARRPILPVFVMVDRRRALHRAALTAHPAWPVIPMASAVEQMADRRAPIGTYARASPAATAFADLWRHIEQRLAG